MQANQPAERDLAKECLAAVDVLRTAKNAFFWLAAVAVLIHLTAWFSAGPAASRARGTGATTAANPGVSPESPPSTGDASSHSFAQVIETRLPLVGFVGRASVLVCCGVFVLCLLISLTGRIGGAAGFAKACVWSLGALAMVTPWVGADSRQLWAFRSAFFDGDELYSFDDGFVALIRFVLCPLLVIAFLVIAQLQFRSSYRQVTLPASGRLPIHEL
ncbi:MAG: hypothetical protein KF841_02290 [Phycisphaerae bacterium]|nr:hypothetical protein [Phycisphaerae bacterium]